MTEPLTKAEIAAMRERCEAATPFTNNDVTRYEHGGGRIWLQEDGDGRKLVADLYHEGDREFFAHARTDLPRLLDELERTRDALRQLVADSDAANDGRLPYVSTVTLNRSRALLPPEEPGT